MGRIFYANRGSEVGVLLLQRGVWLAVLTAVTLQDLHQLKYFHEHGRPLLVDYVKLELEKKVWLPAYLLFMHAAYSH